MSGKIELPQLFIIATSIVAIATDLYQQKIFNWLTIPAILSAWVYFGLMASQGGIGESLLGALTGLALFIGLFAIGHLGAGDVKLLMAYGAWGGWKFALGSAIGSILLGALMAAVILLAKNKLGLTFAKMALFLGTLKEGRANWLVPEMDRSEKLTFAIPMGIAAIWLVLDPGVLDV